MDQPAHEIGVHAGVPQPAWCDRCQLPAALTVAILTVDDDGVSVVGEASGCPECRSGCFVDEPTT